MGFSLGTPSFLALGIGLPLKSVAAIEVPLDATDSYKVTDFALLFGYLLHNLRFHVFIT